MRVEALCFFSGPRLRENFPSIAKSWTSGVPSMDAINSSFKRVLKATTVWKTGGRNRMKKMKVLMPPVQCSLYDFRRTVATRLAEAGINPKMLQRILGHKTISVTLKYYIGVSDKMIDEARTAMATVLIS